MSNKVKVEILTNGKTEVLQMLKRFNTEIIEISDSGLFGCDAPNTRIFIFINSNQIKELIKELDIINQSNYYTGINNYPSIREYI